MTFGISLEVFFVTLWVALVLGAVIVSFIIVAIGNAVYAWYRGESPAEALAEMWKAG